MNISGLHLLWDFPVSKEWTPACGYVLELHNSWSKSSRTFWDLGRFSLTSLHTPAPFIPPNVARKQHGAPSAFPEFTGWINQINLQLLSSVMSSPSTQSDVDSKLELHLSRPGPSVWERRLLSECLLHCCAESRLWARSDAVHITTSSPIWARDGAWTHTFLTLWLYLVSLPLFCSVWGGCGVFSTSSYNSAAVCPPGGLPGPSLPSRYQPAGSPARVIDWLSGSSVFHLYLAAPYLLYNCVLLLFRVCLMLDYRAKRLANCFN